MEDNFENSLDYFRFMKAYKFPLVRRIIPKLIPLSSVIPMLAPKSKIETNLEILRQIK